MEKPRTDFDPIDTMRTMGLAYQAVLHSLRLGLFNALDSGPLSAEQVAERFGLDVPRAEALLDLLAAAGLLESGPGGYADTPVASEYLVESSPFFQGAAIELHDRFDTFVMDGFESLIRGESSPRGRTDDGWSAEDTMRGAVQFAVKGGMQDTVEFIAALPNFREFRTMCDIGGNHGEFSMALLDRNPNLSAVVADLPGVVPTANERYAERGYADRLEAFVCDLRATALPRERYDLVLASHVLYAFEDLEAFAGMVYASLRPGGWFVAQHMNPNANVPAITSRVLELITRMCGYATHHISLERQEKTLRQAGFRNLVSVPTGMNQNGLAVAGQKPEA